MYYRILPIPTNITPATLSVALAPAPANTSVLNVPTVDFDNLNFVAAMPGDPGLDPDSRVRPPSTYYYSGPSQKARQVAVAVASLSCADVVAPIGLAMQQNIAKYLNIRMRDESLVVWATSGLSCLVRAHR